MPKRYFRNSGNKLVSVTQSDDLATPTDHTVVTEAAIRAVYPESSGPIYVQGVFDGSTYTPPSNQLSALTDEEKELLRFHEVYRAYQTTCRQGIWSSVKDPTGDDRFTIANLKATEEALIATDRWAYSQIGLADRIIRNEWPTTALTSALKIAALNHIAKWIGSYKNVYTWYSVVGGSDTMISSSRQQWAAKPVIGASFIYSDIITAAGAVVSPDAMWDTPITQFHANFDPELSTLRSTA